MNLKMNKKKYIDKKSLDNLIELYQNDKLTYETFIQCLIDNQKRLVASEVFKGKEESLAGEIFLKRLNNADIDIVI